jgi:hypothetical protein
LEEEIMNGRVVETEKDWAQKEFDVLDLGDLRLNSRLVTLIRQMAAKPTASIPMACGGRAEMEAGYRLLSNEKVKWDKIAQPHWIATEERGREHPVVLCLADTTELDFNGQKAQGLGPLSYESQRGMYLHASYMVTPERLPLGVSDLWMWARELKDKNGVRPGQKESLRWIEGYERVAEMAERMPATRLVYVADRESDIAALMWRAKELGDCADWLVRSMHNRRCLVQSDSSLASTNAAGEQDALLEQAEPEIAQLWALTTSGEPLEKITFTMPTRGEQKARVVRQSLWTRRVNICVGKDRYLEVTCIVPTSAFLT